VLRFAKVPLGLVKCCFLLGDSNDTERAAHGNKGFVKPTKSFAKVGIAKISCYNSKTFGSINKTFGRCGKMFGCNNKNFICCP